MSTAGETGGTVNPTGMKQTSSSPSATTTCRRSRRAHRQTVQRSSSTSATPSRSFSARMRPRARPWRCPRSACRPGSPARSPWRIFPPSSPAPARPRTPPRPRRSSSQRRPPTARPCHARTRSPSERPCPRPLRLPHPRQHRSWPRSCRPPPNSRVGADHSATRATSSHGRGRWRAVRARLDLRRHARRRSSSGRG